MDFDCLVLLCSEITSLIYCQNKGAGFQMVIQYFYKRVYNPEAIEAAKKNRHLRIFGLAIALGSYIGWRIGSERANKEDMEKYLVKFETEDQIYDILNRTKKPVFLYYYVPGEWHSIYFREHFMKCAKENNDKLTFTKINCTQHYNMCRNKNINEIPKIFLHKPVFDKNAEDGKMKGFETVEYNKDLGSYGIKTFLQENELLPKDEPYEGLYDYVFSKVYKQ